jgi:hypothetical protein
MSDSQRSKAFELVAATGLLCSYCFYVYKRRKLKKTMLYILFEIETLMHDLSLEGTTLNTVLLKLVDRLQIA